jgi:hypothetical protein
MREWRSSGDQGSGGGTAHGVDPGKRTLTESLVPVQRKANSAKAGPADPSAARSGQGAALDPSIQAGMGSYFGADFSGVRVHQGGAVDGMLHGAGATAMAQGTNLYFRSGSYDPSSRSGQELIGHELTHVVQQSEGRVPAGGSAQGKGEHPSSNALEHEADAKGAEAAAAMSADGGKAAPSALLAEAKRREGAGEPVPVAKTANASKAHPGLKDMMRAMSGREAPQQHKRVTDENYFDGGLYNQVIINGIDTLKFIEIDDMAAGSVQYDLGAHLGATTHGWNSQRDGNFGVEHVGPKGSMDYNYDGFKEAKWSRPVQESTGGEGSHTISMHNWAFENIEVSQSFPVVPGVVSVTKGEMVTHVPVVDAKIPVMVNGTASVTVGAGQVTKANQGWMTGQTIGKSTTVTRSMSLGLNVGLGQKDAWKVGAEGGISSSNSKTVWDQVQAQSTKQITTTAAVDASTKVTGDGPNKPKQAYVYPYYTVYNYDVKAYPHEASTARVTGEPKTIHAAFMQLAGLEQINAGEDGAMKPLSNPSTEVEAEKKRLEEEKAGKEVKAGGAKLKVKLVREDSMLKDFDHQDYLHELPPGATADMTGTFGKEVQNSFAITDSGGTKVSSTGGWSLGVSGGVGGDGKDAAAPSAGGKVGVSEMTTAAAEYGDVVAKTGNVSVSESLKTSVSVGPGTKDSDKVTQVIFTPVFRERVYQYDVEDPAHKTWVTAPFKGRSREYAPVPAVTTKDIPIGSERKAEAVPKLDVDSAVQAAADDVKKLRALRDKEPDPKKKAAIDAKIEGNLASQREKLEETVRKAHPSLEAIDRAKNIYRIMINVGGTAAGTHEQPFVGTLEALMDYTPPSVGVQNAASTLATKDADAKDGATVTSQAGLGGTGAQGRAHPFPGDVDLSESIKISAPTADGAASAFAASIVQTVHTAEAHTGKDQKLGYLFLEMMVGTYPTGAKDEGKPVKFSRAETLAQSKSFVGKDGKTHTMTLAQAIAAPIQNRAANTYWRGPIDASGTYGEITKVLSYEAVDSKTGATLFASGKIGQGYQEVAFGKDDLIHDVERTKLLDALTPQIAEYAGKKQWVKAMKRAYTVARMLDDVKALNDFKLITTDEAGELKTVTEHLTAYNDDIVNPAGKATAILSAEDSKTKADNLKHRIAVLDKVGSHAGAEMDKAIAMGRGAEGDLRGNKAAFAQIHDHVIPPLEKALEGDKEYGERAAFALRSNGYLRDK